MLIQVCFNGKIYYKKKEWLHTPELSVIYTVFNAIWNLNSRNLEMNGNFLTISTIMSYQMPLYHSLRE
jgi:hypothetical protein